MSPLGFFVALGRPAPARLALLLVSTLLAGWVTAEWRLSAELSVAQPKGVGRARASVSEPLRMYAMMEIATGNELGTVPHEIPVAITLIAEACGHETAGLLLFSSCLKRLALEAWQALPRATLALVFSAGSGQTQHVGRPP